MRAFVGPTSQMTEREKPPIPALLPSGRGHQFVLYGDACSGVAGAPHQKTFAAVNAVVRRLEPQPEFIIFTGDEVIGLTPERQQLEAQWSYWFDHEMAWLDRNAIPMWHCTGNHTTYDQMSEEVFRDVLDMPKNGPPGQEGLSYSVRRGDLLMVFVHTLWTGLGGEGYVETEWLEAVLADQSDAAHKLVVGHHPVFPVNGFAGEYQRTIAPECADRFWDVLAELGVQAYLCSHILAYDVQVHRGVLQICTAGAGTAHRMPEGDEYLHALQVALDDSGLRWQVLDVEGKVREKLNWPAAGWTFGDRKRLSNGEAPGCLGSVSQMPIVRLEFCGIAAADGRGEPQTLIDLGRSGALPSLWIGLRGTEQRLTAIIGNDPGRSPHFWFGPALAVGCEFAFEILLHPDMGPGGLLYRICPDGSWTSLTAASSWGLERMIAPVELRVGNGAAGTDDVPFRGRDLEIHLSVAQD